MCVVLGFGMLILGPYGSRSICLTCHRVQDCSELQIPLIRMPLFWRTTERPTLAEKWLQTHRPPPAHQHDRAFALGHRKLSLGGSGPGRKAFELSNNGAAMRQLEASRRFDTPERIAELILSHVMSPRSIVTWLPPYLRLYELTPEACQKWHEET